MSAIVITTEIITGPPKRNSAHVPNNVGVFSVELGLQLLRDQGFTIVYMVGPEYTCIPCTNENELIEAYARLNGCGPHIGTII